MLLLSYVIYLILSGNTHPNMKEVPPMQTIYRSEAGKQAILATYKGILQAWPVPNKQYAVNTAYGDTFVIESGNNDAPALLLLHGSMANSFTWFSDVPALSQHYHVFAVDLIGEAGLSAESRPAYQSGAYEKWLDEVRQQLGVTSCSMVGLSLGGWMALRYATVFPQNVERLVLLCPGGLYRERRDFLWKSLLMKLRKGGVHKTVRGVMGGRQAEADGMEKVLAYIALIGRQEKPRMAKLAIFSDEELARLTIRYMCCSATATSCCAHRKASADRAHSAQRTIGDTAQHGPTPSLGRRSVYYNS
jgi:pimeloyl-ACP methyl ester carboxylesterase